MPPQIASLVDGSLISGVAFAIGIAAVCLWLAAAWWTYGDMARRTDSDLARYGAAAWILLSAPPVLFLSLPVYLLARPQATAAQRRSRELVATLGPEAFGAVRCEACGELADEESRRCPSCASWLQVACVGCDRWSATNLELCPWCATPRVDEPGELGEDVAAAAELEPLDDLSPETAPAPVFALLPEMPVFAADLAEVSPTAMFGSAAGTPGLRDLRRSERRGRGFGHAVDDVPAAIGR